jgi:hypothetical protein
MPSGARMKAVVAYTRAKLWRQRQSWLSLALLTALAGGAVLAAVAGAGRTDSAYHRFAVRYRAADVTVLPPFSPGLAQVDLARVAQLPEVAVSGRVELLAHDGPQTVTVTLDGKYGRDVNAAKVLSGRLPRPDRLDEAAIDFDYARRAHVRVGTTMVLNLARLVGPAVPYSFRVVGMVASPGAFPPAIDGYFPSDIHLSQAFFVQYRGEVKSFEELAVRLRRGDSDLPSFEAGLRRLADNVPVLDTRQSQQAANVQRALHLQAQVLRLLGAFLGVTAGLVVGQLLSRRSTLAAVDHPTLRAMGMTRTQLWLSDMVIASVIGVVAGALALGTALAISPLLPVGTARIAEPHPGFSVDTLILGVGALAIVVTVMILAAFPSWRAVSRAREAIDGACERPGLVARAATAASLPPTATVGVGLGLNSGRGRTAVPIRSSLAGVALAIGALTAAVTFGASLTHLPPFVRLELGRPHHDHRRNDHD